MQSFDQQQIQISLQQFIKQLQQCTYSYSQQYLKWQHLLNQHRHQNVDNYLYLLSRFLEYFPFNKKYWLEYIAINGSQSYITALSKNPKCYELWENYLQCLKEKINIVEAINNLNTNTPVSNIELTPLKIVSSSITPQVFKKQIERAIMEIGADSRAGAFYRIYYTLLNQNSKYQFYKKIFTRCLFDIEEFYSEFQKWLDLCTPQQIGSYYTKENKGKINYTVLVADGSQSAITSPLPNTVTIQLQTAKNFLRAQIQKIYNKTLIYRQQRTRVEKQIKWWYFEERFNKNTQPSQEEVLTNYHNFCKLIQLERLFGIADNISYCYQRSILSHTDHLDIWQETFHYLQNQTGKYPRVLAILRNNINFFINYPSKSLYFYWCDLQERENANKARQIYMKLENYYLKDIYNIGNHTTNTKLEINTLSITQLKQTSSLTNIVHQISQIFLKHIQFEIRQKQWNNAKQLFDVMLLLYSQNIELLCYIIIQYVNFITKYYKDYQYPKKLLKSYFEYLPYNNYLFINYLEFMKNYQNKEGYYDQLMTVIINALNKAKKTLRDQQYGKVVKIVKYHLRSVLNSIYLIKISERRVMEVDGNKQ